MSSPRRTTRWIIAIAAVLLMPAALTACSSDVPEAPTTSSGTEAATKAAACMRDKGYDQADPGADGSVALNVPDGVDVDKYLADSASCTDKAGAGSSKRRTGPLPRAAAEDWKKTVACVRDHGFPDFPDDQTAADSYRPADKAAFDDVTATCGGGSGGGTGSE